MFSFQDGINIEPQINWMHTCIFMYCLNQALFLLAKSKASIHTIAYKYHTVLVLVFFFCLLSNLIAPSAYFLSIKINNIYHKK